MTNSEEIFDSFPTLYFQPAGIKSAILKAMELAQVACLEKAAQNAQTKDVYVFLEEEQRNVFSHVGVDTDSITSKENLV